MTERRRFNIAASTNESSDGDEALATAVKSLVWDGDDDFLRARIQKSRASGARVLLPSVEPARTLLAETRGRRWMRRVARAAIGIAAFLMAAVVVERQSNTAVPSASAVRLNDTITAARESLADLFAPWPRLAFAQGGVGMPQPYGAVVVTGSKRVLEGDRAYVQLVAPHEGAEMIPVSYNSISVRRDTAENTLCVVNHQSITEDNAGRRGIDVRGLEDTLFMDASTLWPIVHRYTTGDARTDNHSTMVERFYRDRFESDFRLKRTEEDLRLLPKQNRDGRYLVMRESRPVDPSRLYVPYEQSLLLLLQSLPLRDGWRGSIQVPGGLGAIYDQTFSVNLRVDGVDTVSVYRDRYPTWRVLLENGPTPEVWHVRQTTGEVLLVEQRYRGGALRAKRYLIGGLAWPDSGRVGGPAQ